MKRLAISIAVAGLAVLAIVATVSAVGPWATGAERDQVRSRDTFTEVLGLTQAQIEDLRHEGLTLAQIAERQGVDPQRLVDGLVSQWSIRVEARVANGALTAGEATALKEQLALRAKAMVNQAPEGGMRGAAVGAGPAAIAGNGYGAGAGEAAGNSGFRAGDGDGTCDGSGPTSDGPNGGGAGGHGNGGNGNGGGSR
jgi:hypothetical protein